MALNQMWQLTGSPALFCHAYILSLTKVLFTLQINIESHSIPRLALNTRNRCSIACEVYTGKQGNCALQRASNQLELVFLFTRLGQRTSIAKKMLCSMLNSMTRKVEPRCYLFLR